MLRALALPNGLFRMIRVLEEAITVPESLSIPAFELSAEFALCIVRSR